MPTALLLEDEPILRNELRQMLARLWPELEIEVEVGDGDECIAELLHNKPDIAFLDIQVPGTSGLDIARKFSSQVHVVFVTAHEDHAIAAFEQGAVDYVLKPIHSSRLATTIERLQARLTRPPRDLSDVIDRLGSQTQPAGLRWLQATVGNNTKFISLKEVIYFQSDGKYTRVVRARDEAFIRKPLKEVLDGVAPDQFWQIHRGTLVNVDFIDSVMRDAFGSMQLVLKERAEKLPVSRAYQHLFRGA